MTKELRSVLAGAPAPDIQAEAAILIQQNVLPIVIDAQTRLEEERRKRLRKFTTGFTKFVGIMTLGLLTVDPFTAAGRAVSQAVDSADDAYHLLQAPRQPSKTAQFVLGANDFVEGRKRR